LNCDTPDLSVPSSSDYRCEPAAPSLEEILLRASSLLANNEGFPVRSVILAFRILRQEDRKLETSLVYIARPYLIKQKKVKE
jgi:hypothetical protein